MTTTVRDCRLRRAPADGRNHASAPSWLNVGTDPRRAACFRRSPACRRRPARGCASGVTVARYYDPTTAQFLTRDPLSAVTRSPYGYVGGDPLDKADPSGLVTVGLCGGAAGGFLIGLFGQVCPLVIGIDDRNGDISVGGTATYGGGLQTPTFGLSAVAQVSDARNISQLGGPFAYAGGSAGEGPQLTGTIFQGDSCGAPGNQVVGGEFGVGFGVNLPLPGEVHAGASTTATGTYFTFNPLSAISAVAGYFGL